MNQKEQITFYIENFLRDYVEKEIELTALQISKWPVVSSICTNSNSKLPPAEPVALIRHKWPATNCGKPRSSAFHLSF